MERVSNGQNFNDLLSNIYNNPRLSGSFSGVNNLYQAAKLINKNIKIKDVKNFLSHSSTYVDHKEIKRRFLRRKYEVNFPDECWGLDIIFICEYATKNRGFKYLLNCCDFFSKFIYLKPLKKKDAESTLAALESIIEENKGPPRQIYW